VEKKSPELQMCGKQLEYAERSEKKYLHYNRKKLVSGNCYVTFFKKKNRIFSFVTVV